MLHIVSCLKDLNFQMLMDVYHQSNAENGDVNYPYLEKHERILQVHQDFYSFLREFLHEENAFLGIWVCQDTYLAAARLEPYRDGLLLEGLETRPDVRGQGIATSLLHALTLYVQNNLQLPIYSHVNKKNIPSLRVHEVCSFRIIKDYAAFIDGSVSHKSITLKYG